MTGKKYLPYLLGILPAVWLALLIAPSVSGGLPGIIAAVPGGHEYPLSYCVV